MLFGRLKGQFRCQDKQEVATGVSPDRPEGEECFRERIEATLGGREPGEASRRISQNR